MFKNTFLLCCVLLAVLDFGCEPKPAATSNGPDSTHVDSAARMAAAPAPTPVSDSVVLMALAREVLQAAVDKDYAALAAHIHPQQGLRCSPYAYIHVESDKVFLPQAFQDQAAQAKKKITWGTYDPRGEPILSTVDGYFKEFVTDKPYLTEGTWAYNTPIGSSTVINNLTEVYPQAKFVETHWVTKNEEMAPFDWGSVRLVFEQVDGKYFLVGLVHDAWGT
jgi:hypothetical protein